MLAGTAPRFWADIDDEAGKIVSTCGGPPEFLALDGGWNSASGVNIPM
jgi:hypothetical protein